MPHYAATYFYAGGADYTPTVPRADGQGYEALVLDATDPVAAFEEAKARYEATVWESSKMLLEDGGFIELTFNPGVPERVMLISREEGASRHVLVYVYATGQPL